QQPIVAEDRVENAWQISIAVEQATQQPVVASDQIQNGVQQRTFAQDRVQNGDRVTFQRVATDHTIERTFVADDGFEAIAARQASVTAEQAVIAGDQFEDVVHDTVFTDEVVNHAVVTDDRLQDIVQQTSIKQTSAEQVTTDQATRQSAAENRLKDIAAWQNIAADATEQAIFAQDRVQHLVHNTVFTQQVTDNIVFGKQVGNGAVFTNQLFHHFAHILEQAVRSNDAVSQLRYSRAADDIRHRAADRTVLTQQLIDHFLVH